MVLYIDFHQNVKGSARFKINRYVYVAPLKKTFNLTVFPDAFLTQKTPATPPLAFVSSNAASTLAGSSVPAIRLFFLYIFRLFVFFIALLGV
jgi:hypothetical protein